MAKEITVRISKTFFDEHYISQSEKQLSFIPQNTETLLITHTNSSDDISKYEGKVSWHNNGKVKGIRFDNNQFNKFRNSNPEIKVGDEIYLVIESYTNKEQKKLQKIKDATRILEQFGIQNQPPNDNASLVFLALCGLWIEDAWGKVGSNYFVGERYIVEFIVNNYESGFAESKSVLAILNSFVARKIISLEIIDGKQYYALTPIVLNIVKKYGDGDWETTVLGNYKKFISETDQEQTIAVKYKYIYIRNYKSIADDGFELGGFNVFIGANGCGKSNILEALAILGASKANDLNFDGLYSRGVRIARPDLMLSSFLKPTKKGEMDFNLLFETENKYYHIKSSISPNSQNDIYTKWIDLAEEPQYPEIQINNNSELFDKKQANYTGFIEGLNKGLNYDGKIPTRAYDNLLSEYSIFDLKVV